MNREEQEKLQVLRRFTQAGIADCKRALAEFKGDIYAAIRSLMSDEQIRLSIADRRIREVDGLRSSTDPFVVKEGEIIRHLAGMIGFETRWQKECAPPTGSPLPLPTTFRSYEDLVSFVKTTMHSELGHDSFVSQCKQRGIPEADIGYVLDRIAGGEFRAAAEQHGIAGATPDGRTDPVGHAAYMLAMKPRKWWQFWRY